MTTRGRDRFPRAAAAAAARPVHHEPDLAPFVALRRRHARRARCGRGVLFNTWPVRARARATGAAGAAGAGAAGGGALGASRPAGAPDRWRAARAPGARPPARTSMRSARAQPDGESPGRRRRPRSQQRRRSSGRAAAAASRGSSGSRRARAVRRPRRGRGRRWRSRRRRTRRSRGCCPPRPGARLLEQAHPLVSALRLLLMRGCEHRRRRGRASAGARRAAPPPTGQCRSRPTGRRCIRSRRWRCTQVVVDAVTHLSCIVLQEWSALGGAAAGTLLGVARRPRRRRGCTADLGLALAAARAALDFSSGGRVGSWTIATVARAARDRVAAHRQLARVARRAARAAASQPRRGGTRPPRWRWRRSSSVRRPCRARRAAAARAERSARGRGRGRSRGARRRSPSPTSRSTRSRGRCSSRAACCGCFVHRRLAVEQHRRGTRAAARSRCVRAWRRGRAAGDGGSRRLGTSPRRRRRRRRSRALVAAPRVARGRGRVGRGGGRRRRERSLSDASLSSLQGLGGARGHSLGGGAARRARRRLGARGGERDGGERDGYASGWIDAQLISEGAVRARAGSRATGCPSSRAHAACALGALASQPQTPRGAPGGRRARAPAACSACALHDLATEARAEHRDGARRCKMSSRCAARSRSSRARRPSSGDGGAARARRRARATTTTTTTVAAAPRGIRRSRARAVVALVGRARRGRGGADGGATRATRSRRPARAARGGGGGEGGEGGAGGAVRTLPTRARCRCSMRSPRRRRARADGSPRCAASHALREAPTRNRR